MPVLERGTPTPADALVFVPIDGRSIAVPSPRLFDAHPELGYSMWPQAIYAVPARAAEWVLVPCLIGLRDEFNQRAPSRDKASDGSIGNTAHAASSSDHNPDESGATPYEDSDRVNEVHAIDVDSSGPWPAGWSMQRCVDVIVARHRAGDDDRLQYVIFNRRIISRSWGWAEWHTYTGASPHTEHAHFSARYTTAQESDTSQGVLKEEDDTDLKDKIGDSTYPNRDVGDVLRDLVHLRGWLLGEPKDSTVTPPKAGSPLDAMLASARTTPALSATVATLGQMVKLLVERTADDDTQFTFLADRFDVLQTMASRIPQATGDMLGTADMSAAELAAVLAPVLGDRSAEVGRILAGEQTGQA